MSPTADLSRFAAVPNDGLDAHAPLSVGFTTHIWTRTRLYRRTEPGTPNFEVSAKVPRYTGDLLCWIVGPPTVQWTPRRRLMAARADLRFMYNPLSPTYLWVIEGLRRGGPAARPNLCDKLLLGRAIASPRI